VTYETIIYDKPEEGVARITLNRPEARNAMSVKLIQELKHAAQTAPETEGTGALVNGGNEKASRPGRDSRDGGAMKTATGASQSVLGNDGLGPVTWQHPKCTIAQVQGYALGGGDLLASGCDITIAAEEARFGFPEARWGSPSGRNGGWFWNWLIG